MLCRKIEVTSFRNIAHADVAFCDGINVLCGENAQGKTNLLEAIYYAAIGKSFRGQSNGELIRFGDPFAVLSLSYFGKGREQNITARLLSSKARTLEKNKVSIRRVSDLVGEFRAVLFSPEHLSLIKDGPAERRQFLDIAVCGSEPLYLRSLQRYNQILKQRNALLKKAADDPRIFAETGDVWSAQLAKEAAVIAAYRHRYVGKAETYVKECFAEMTGTREVPELKYLGVAKEETELYNDPAALEETVLRKLTGNTTREIAAGATLWGIHKDDVEIELNGKSARSYCSQGQQRSLALALKMAEGEICREDCGEYPVFLFDDVLSELDGARREYLLQKIRGRQVILTTCERDSAPAGRRIFVKNGVFSEG